MVYSLAATNLQAVANDDMAVTVQAGPVWINGYFYINSDLILSIDPADGLLSRIIEVVRWDTSQDITAGKGKFNNNSSASFGMLTRMNSV